MQSKSRLTAAERGELQQLRRDERQNAQQNLTADQLKAASTNNQQRIQALQSKGRLTPAERRELRGLERDERQNARLQQQQQLKQQQQATQDAAAQSKRAQRRQDRREAVSAQQVAQGRFASNLSANYQGRRAARRAARLAALTAWQLGVLAPYVPWRGPVYWPYAYADVFYYTFWPDAYDPGYWAYAYDDFFDGVFFPDGAPYVEYAAEGPYDTSYARTNTTGSRNYGYRRRSAPAQWRHAAPVARPRQPGNPRLLRRPGDRRHGMADRQDRRRGAAEQRAEGAAGQSPQGVPGGCRAVPRRLSGSRCR